MAYEYFKRTPTSTGNRKVFTWGAWVKIGKLGDSVRLFETGTSSATDRSILYFSGNKFQYFTEIGNTGKGSLSTDATFRDVSTWYHVIWAFDLTKNSIKIYVNGVDQPLTSTVATANESIYINATNTHYIGQSINLSTGYLQGQLSDVFLVDGQALTPDVFGFYKDGDGYMSSGTSQATDFRPGQWSPRSPKSIKYTINRSGGFGVNGFYLPMNDSSNPGADFHCAPNSIIKLKGEDLPQPRNGAPTTTDAYVSELRDDPFAANLVLAVPGISTATGSNLVTNGSFDSDLSSWTVEQGTIVWSKGSASMESLTGNSLIQDVTTVVGKRYTMSAVAGPTSPTSTNVGIELGETGELVFVISDTIATGRKVFNTAFTATSTSTEVRIWCGTGTNAFWSNVTLKQEDAPRDYSADIKGSGTNKTLTANSGAGVGYEIPGYYGSAMIFDGTGDQITAPSSTDLQLGASDFTIEAWVNYTAGVGADTPLSMDDGTNTYAPLFGYLNTTNGTPLFYLSSTGTTWDITQNGGLSFGGNISVGQWTHLAVVREGTNLSVYRDGVCVNVLTDLGTKSIYQGTNQVSFGRAQSDKLFEGQIQDVRIYKGVAKYKGGFDVPKPYTPVGILAFRTTDDTCKNNFATLNPLFNAASGNVALLDGNLSYTGTFGTSYAMTQATQGVSSGKWYWEFRLGDTLGPNIGLGVMRTGPETAFVSGVDGGIGFYHGVANNIYYWNGSSQVSVSYTIPACTTGDIISIALDLENGKIYYAKNGTWGDSGNPSTGTNPVGLTLSGLYLPALSVGAAGSSNGAINFGQNPSFSGTTTAGTNADSNSKGLFKYAPPTGFLAVCADNLPTPAIADPGKYMRTVLYGGDSNSGHSITGVGFKPDFVWIKNRDTSQSHYLFDTIRGVDQVLWTDLPNQENDYTASGGRMPSFDSDGFTVNYSSSTGTNASGDNYVAWCWRAGGAAVSNTDGTITSQVSVNQEAGFSIATYTTLDAATTFGHGLGKKPAFAIFKARNNSGNWAVYHQSLGTNTIRLSTAGNQDTGVDAFNSTSPTDTLMHLGTWAGTNGLNINWISYLWSEIEGFSKFGSYVGNGNDDGPFVYCGFKPAWVMVKRFTIGAQGTSWQIFDGSRGPTNPNPKGLYANTTLDESDVSGDYKDFLSNGFKIRGSSLQHNTNEINYIFMAFAESPFQTANAK